MTLQEQRAHMAREQIDYVRFCRLADPVSGALTPKDREWMLSKSVRYLALLLAMEDWIDRQRGAHDGPI